MGSRERLWSIYGETWGFPIVLPKGHPGREGVITLTCSSGAVGKCVRFGYEPCGPFGDYAPDPNSVFMHKTLA